MSIGILSITLVLTLESRKKQTKVTDWCKLDERVPLLNLTSAQLTVNIQMNYKYKLTKVMLSLCGLRTDKKILPRYRIA